MKQLEIRIQTASDNEVTAVMEAIVDVMLSEQDLKALQQFRDNFSSEFETDPNRFIALPPERRTYFFAYNGERREALLSLSKRAQPYIVNLASFGRIIPKHSGAADGWKYLMALVEQVVIPNKYKRIVALIMSKGGLKAFHDLRQNSKDKSYSVEVASGTPGYSGMIIVH
jgi:hypothetical protein